MPQQRRKSQRKKVGGSECGVRNDDAVDEFMNGE